MKKALYIAVLVAALAGWGFALYGGKRETRVPVAQPGLAIVGAQFQHPMGSPCSGPAEHLCELTVAGIRADERNEYHGAIKVSIPEQDALRITGAVAFTVQMRDEAGNSAWPWERPESSDPVKVWQSGPAKKGSGGKYHLVVTDAEGVQADPHIVICPPDICG